MFVLRVEACEKGVRFPTVRLSPVADAQDGRTKKQRSKHPKHRNLTLGNTRMTGTPFFAQQITGGQVNAVGMRVVAVFNVHGPDKVHVSQLVTFQTGLFVGFMNADIVWIATTG